jgi:hypothetical protein
VRRLEAILKRKVVNIDKDDGDDNSADKFWEFIDLDKLESWSIKIDPMTTFTHFVHKLKNVSTFFPISHDELVREVLFKNGSTVLVHCEMRGDKPYKFTIYVEYSKSPFHLPTFLKNLENTNYESQMQELKEQVD